MTPRPRGAAGRVSPPENSARARFSPHAYKRLNGSVRRAIKESLCTFTDRVVKKYQALCALDDFFAALKELSLLTKRIDTSAQVRDTRYRWDGSRPFPFTLIVETHSRSGEQLEKPVCIEIQMEDV